MRYDRDDDMAITGKRHDFVAHYDVGFDGKGGSPRCGSIWRRAAGFRPTCPPRSTIARCSMPTTPTGCRGGDPEPPPAHHTVSNTAFRGFGGPQGMIAIERVIDAIAADLGRDPLEVRRANLYAPGRDITPMA
jgi:xanthine dehydrogenase large subunit